MRYNHLEGAVCLFIDGPVAVYINHAESKEVLAAFDRLRKMVEVAASHFEEPAPKWQAAVTNDLQTRGIHR